MHTVTSYEQYEMPLYKNKWEGIIYFIKPIETCMGQMKHVQISRNKHYYSTRQVHWSIFTVIVHHQVPILSYFKNLYLQIFLALLHSCCIKRLLQPYQDKLNHASCLHSVTLITKKFCPVTVCLSLRYRKLLEHLIQVLLFN